MKFIVLPKIWADYPELSIGVAVAKNIDNSKNSPEIEKLLRQAEESVKSSLTLETLADHPHIACWHQAYREFGANPREFRPSNEALARLVLNGKQLRNINPLVDLYNYISLKYLLTLGGEDLDMMEGNLMLDFATGNEQFIPLGQEQNDPPAPGEVVYKDNLGVICRRWNWREGDRTKLTEKTRNAILVTEGLSPIPVQVVKNATQELAQLIQKYCGGQVQTCFLDKDNPITGV